MEDFSRYDQYDISEDDPYLIKDSECLENLLGITNTSDLNEAESAISVLAKAGWYFNQINMIHSFREGNGRTQRIFLDQLAAANSFAFNWSAISQQAMGLACREGRTIDLEGVALSRLLALNIVKIEE